jgi:hypothetical protein
MTDEPHPEETDDDERLAAIEDATRRVNRSTWAFTLVAAAIVLLIAGGAFFVRRNRDNEREAQAAAAYCKVSGALNAKRPPVHRGTSDRRRSRRRG